MLSGGGIVLVTFFTVILPALALTAIVKLPVYFLLAKVFKYRVSRPSPLSTVDCIAIVATLAGTGPLILTGLLLLARLPIGFGQPAGIIVLYVLLCIARAVTWWAVGRTRGALRKRALSRFVLVGVAIDVVFDLLLLLAMITALWSYVAVVVTILIVWPYMLALGHRPDLLERYAGVICTGCGYDLRGNKHGCCPECGLPFGDGPIEPYGDYEA